ncbi:MAG: gamma-glutamyltransferase [Candidatus Marinimicrobia bacterium]|nr:gamma-glutamyltransferase [Candidatus Neomarinimicrobiota bacterium]MBT3630724.1 gamma-glutamyltransferase [Candidatus Neomarinimicrobiota bacterium]MBT3825619.1 gamma-glutamyltransferase [Candidatus Neomarinimicrobiota bacterium]MBT4132623.1 gamma-glutamyltransferase [Candidatus Neomarinimicrobiota bacterium]MBT4294320.1 gamma-glutamyltransferase [Candidatus Neomarinimicrobiota bacterium]
MRNINKSLLIIIVAALLVGCANWISQPGQESGGMVVAAHPFAAEFGYEILLSGGNAIDAAVATAIALGVVEPHASGFGGGGGMLIYLDDSQKLSYINYYPRTGMTIPETFDSKLDGQSAKAVLVPGTVSGLSMALEKYGTMSWKELLERTIEKLRQGFVIDDHFNKVILDSYEILTDYPETEAIFLNEMLPYEVGDTLVNEPALHTLQILADNGPRAFYTGEIADSVEAVMVRQGGFIRKADLESYRAIEMAPVASDYRNHRIVSSAPPQSGVTLLEILNILEQKDLSEMGIYYEHDSTLHFMAEAIKVGYADRGKYLGDPAFSEIPVSTLSSDDYARTRFEAINMGALSNSDSTATSPGSIDTFMGEPHDDPNGSTTHISVIDKEGNAVSLTQTVSYYWGSGISVGGFLLNNAMTSFSKNGGPNSIAPGKQPRSTISPSFIFKDEQLYAVVGTPGGGRIPGTMTEVVTSLVDFGANAEQANNAPRFHSTDNSQKLRVESGFDQALLDQLESKGHIIETMGDMNSYFGGVHLIVIDPETGELQGAADPRRSGVVAGK